MLLCLCIYTSACSDNKFQSDSGQSNKIEPQPSFEAPQYSAPFTPTPICDNTTEYDENAEFTFNDGGEITKFFAQVSGAPNMPGTGTSGDMDTAKYICNKKGYRDAAAIDDGRFKSCSDNYILFYNLGTGKTQLVNACERNKTMKLLVCMGKEIQVDCNGNKIGETQTNQ
jgi:hypothetical protein